MFLHEAYKGRYYWGHTLDPSVDHTEHRKCETMFSLEVFTHFAFAMLTLTVQLHDDNTKEKSPEHLFHDCSRTRGSVCVFLFLYVCVFVQKLNQNYKAYICHKDIKSK